METNETPTYPEGHNLLKGKSVVITAAAGSGIGFATAKRCAEEGARVLLSDTHENRLAESCRHFKVNNSRHTVFHAT